MENNPKKIHRLKTGRQERQKNHLGNVTIKYNARHYQVRDYTSFSLSVFVENEQFQKSVEVELFVSDTLITNLVVEFIREDVDELASRFCAFRIASNPIDMTQMEAAIKTHQVLLEDQTLPHKRNEKIPGEFLVATYEMKGWLEDLEKKVHSLSIRSFENPEHYLNEYENTICQIISHHLTESLPAWYVRLHDSIKNADEETTNHAYQFFREQVGPFLYQSYYSHRAFQKPLGYAGDFEMMNTVYHNEKRGDTLFARCMHTYFTDVPEAKAVRNRANFLLEKIEKCLKAAKKPVKILAVASGPAQELQDLLNFKKDLIPPGSELHLLDQDEGALQYSQKMLMSLINKSKVDVKIVLHRRQIKEVISNGLEMKDFDLIYSAGLFDYLSDPVAGFAANSLYQSLAHKGELIIGNFNVNIPNEFGMSLIMDWQLIYRSEKDLDRIFRQTTDNVVVEAEPEGINLFAILDKNAA